MAIDIQKEEITTDVNLPYSECTGEKLRHMLRSHKIRSTFYSENYFVDRKIEWSQKIKTILLVKLTVATAKQSTLVNLNSL